MRTHITSRDNPLCRQLVKLARSRAAREQQGLFLCDGRTLLVEALAYGAPLVTVVCAAGMELPDLSPDVHVVELPARLMDAVSPTDTPQGIVFLCRLPDMSPMPPLTGGRYVLLDRVQDPGNVGSILRTASAFGLTAVLLGPGCADPFSPKTVRAGMGACFRQRVAILEDVADALSGCALPVYATALSAQARDVREVDLSACVLLLGNEGAGLSDALLRRADAHVRIPMSKDCQSLGVAAAAAVLLWEMTGR